MSCSKLPLRNGTHPWSLAPPRAFRKVKVLLVFCSFSYTCVYLHVTEDENWNLSCQTLAKRMTELGPIPATLRPSFLPENCSSHKFGLKAQPTNRSARAGFSGCRCDWSPLGGALVQTNVPPRKLFRHNTPAKRSVTTSSLFSLK